MAPIETEVKLRIDGREDFERLLGALPRPRRWGLQLNLYLDTDTGTFRGARMTLRVRITPDHARLTWKHGRGVDGCTFRSTEIETVLNRAEAVRWVRTGAFDGLDLGALEGFEEASVRLGGAALRITNWSLTRRAVCDTPRGITVEADETVFPDGFRDFEVEAEDDDPALALEVIEEAAQAAGVTLRPQPRTKHARADLHRGSLPIPIPEGDPAAGLPDGYNEG
jgi:uncharacterized protein YjbK